MGRIREALAILIKPNDALLYPETQQRWRGRARVQSTSRVNTLAIVAASIVVVLVVLTWIFTSFGLFRDSAPTTEAPPPAPSPARARGSSGVTRDFDQHHTHEQLPQTPPAARPVPEPPKPMLATATTVNGAAPSLAAIESLTQAMTEMAKNMHSVAGNVARLEGKVDHLSQPPKVPPVPATGPSPGQLEQKKAAEARAKEDLAARQSGPISGEKKRDKDGISYYRRGKLGEYRLASGWNIPIVLQDEASNQSPGVYGFTVREAVSDSASGERVVLPQYSYGLVSITGGQLFGDVELPAKLVALNLPDGTPIKTGETSVGDAAARSGFRDQIDRRTWNVILTTFVRAGLRIGTAGIMGGAGSDIGDRAGAAVVNEGIRETANQVQQSANTSPIHTVRPGYMGNIKVVQPVDLGMLYAIR